MTETLHRMSVARWAPRAALLALGCLGGTAAWADVQLPLLERVRVVEPAREVGDFELTDTSGRPFKFSTLHGRPLLVSFGFTSCPDVCPTIMARLRVLMRTYEVDLKDTAVVLISVDGERDTPAAMKAFVEQFSQDFIGLTGDPAVVREVAARFPAVFFKEAPDADGQYNVAHSGQVYLLDRRGRVRAEFYNAAQESMALVTGLVASEPAD